MVSARREPEPAGANPGGGNIEGLEFAGSQRHLGPTQARLFFWLAAGFTAFHLIVLNVFPIDSVLLRAIHLAWGTTLGFGFFAIARGRSPHAVPWYDWVLIAAAIGCGAYIFVELEGLQFRAGAQYTPGDLVVGVIGTFLVLEFSRRLAGLALTLISAV